MCQCKQENCTYHDSDVTEDGEEKGEAVGVGWRVHIVGADHVDRRA